MKIAELRVGTSGWNYKDWKGIFYPKGLASSGYLGWLSRHFNTAELNFSFYRLPTPAMYRKWAAQTPDGFLLALKVSRYITHIERLVDVEDAWKKFIGNAKALGDKMGPLLVQLPENFKADADRLKSFLKVVHRGTRKRSFRLAFEFRNPGWFDPGILELLKNYDAALVIAQSDRYRQAPLTPTASFIYLRFHGPGKLFASKYDDEQLREWAERIGKWRRQGLPVFAYFNNDSHGYAISDAQALLRMCDRRKPKPSNSASRRVA